MHDALILLNRLLSKGGLRRHASRGAGLDPPVLPLDLVLIKHGLLVLTLNDYRVFGYELFAAELAKAVLDKLYLVISDFNLPPLV